MRLDEWQRWLDSQFMDTKEAPADPEETGPIVQTIDVPQALEASSGTEPPDIDRIYDLQTGLVTAATGAPFAHNPLPNQLETVVPRDLDIPSFESYLPSARRHETPIEPVVPTHLPVAEPEPVLESVMEPHQDVEDTAPELVEEVPSTQIEPTTLASTRTVVHNPFLFQAPPKPMVVSHPDETSLDNPEAEEPRRVITKRTRANKARRAATGTEELSYEEMWGLVPRHIQSLIAIGSEEVAQNSYKRPFKESRIDLVTRLLDPSLSLEDTARLLNVCPTTVRRYTNKGMLNHQRTQGDQRRFKLSDVLAFLESQSKNSQR